MIRSSRRVPLIQRIALAAESRVKYSTKQNPQGVWSHVIDSFKWKIKLITNPFYFVEAHDDALHVTTLGKEFCYLLFSGVETQVSNVQGRSCVKQFILLATSSLWYWISCLSLENSYYKSNLKKKYSGKIPWTDCRDRRRLRCSGPASMGQGYDNLCPLFVRLAPV